MGQSSSRRRVFMFLHFYVDQSNSTHLARRGSFTWLRSATSPLDTTKFYTLDHCLYAKMKISKATSVII